MAGPWDLLVQEDSNAPVVTPTAPNTALKGPWELQLQTQRPQRTEIPRGPTRSEQAQSFIGENPLKRFLTDSRVLAQGVPVLGNFVEHTPETRQRDKMLPISTNAGRMLGGVASTVPLAAALPMTGPLLKQATISGTAGGALNLADAHTSNRPPQDAQENLLTAGIGTVSGALSPALARLLYPAGVRNTLRNPEPANVAGYTVPNDVVRRQSTAMSTLGQPPAEGVPQLNAIVARQGEPRIAQQTASNVAPLVSGLVSGAAGHYLSGGDPVATMLSAAGGMGGQRALSKFANTPGGKSYLGRRMSPEDMMVLNAMGLSAPTYFNSAPQE